MKYRKLGYTGLNISTIGFGTWQIGGGRWSFPDDNKAIQLLNSSLDLGINIYDAATVYGQYSPNKGLHESRSQELLGKAFKTKRENVFYCIKLGQVDEYSHRHNYSPEKIVSELYASLRRLQTDYIDICLIHAPSIFEIQKSSAINILKTLREIGLVRFIGYSFEAEPEHAELAIQQDIDVIMLQYNLMQTSCKHVIELARQHGVGILIGGPYYRGYLTGNHTNSNTLPLEHDYWDYNLNKAPKLVETNIELIKQLIKQHKTPYNLRKEALGFILREPGVTSCVIGHMELNEVVENILITETTEESCPVNIELTGQPDLIELSSYT